MIELSGLALHRGTPATLRLERVAGPLALAADGVTAPWSELVISGTDLGVRVALGAGGPEIDLVEHFFAACGALGVRDGLRATVVGGEVPLVDGGARAFAEALLSLGRSKVEPIRRIVRAHTIVDGDARYELEPADGTILEVECDYPHQDIGMQRARWDGDPGDFVARVAPARTFGFRRDHAALLARGRARGVDPRWVVVFDDDGVHPESRPVGVDEVARHKLLDLIGDFAIHGGPFRGRVRAVRPGHRATHAAIARALRAGVIA